MPRWRLRDRILEFPPPLGAGVVNVTADSFFSGARSQTPERALADGLVLAEVGFDLLDVGAVAARSGPPILPAEEMARLIPALELLAAKTDVALVADTFSVEVAAAALDAGAVAINDISGGADDAMLELVGARGCGYVLMHIEGPAREDREPRSYADPVAEIAAWFEQRLERAVGLGVDAEQIALDPGLDFDLSAEDGVEILRRVGELRALGRPIYMALSRKDVLGAVLAGSWEERRPAEEREAATLAATTLAVAAGVEMLRLHDASALDALRVADAIANPGAAHAHG